MGCQTIIPSAVVAGALLTAGVLFAATAALAEATTVEELVVSSHPSGKVPETISYTVGFADLDLSTDAGMSELRQRINVSAEFVCRQFRETSSSFMASCKRAAIEQAMSEARRKEHAVKAHGTKLVPGQPWVPPPG